MKPIVAVWMLLALVALCTPCLAEVVIVDASGGGDFRVLQDAIDAASDGDTILIRHGTYAETSMIDDKSLVIVGEEIIFAPVSFVHVATLTIRNLSPSRTVLVENLIMSGFSGTVGSPPMPALVLQDNQGDVRIQGGSVNGGYAGDFVLPDGAQAVSVSNCASVVFVNVRCDGGDGAEVDPGEIAGAGGTGLATSGSQLTLYGGASNGGDGANVATFFPPTGGHGGPGILNTNGSLIMAGTQVLGGEGGLAYHGGNGGDGLVLSTASASALLMAGAAASGGDAGSSDDGRSPDGQDVVAPPGTVTTLPGTFHDFGVTTPLFEGETGTLSFGGDAGDSVLLFYAIDVGEFLFTQYQGVLLLAPPLLGPVAIGPPGNLSVNFIVPELGAGIDAVSVHMQPFYQGADGNHLGPAYVLTLFDSGP